jgi:hypothetical protein
MKRLGLPLLLLSLGVRIAGAQSAPPRLADIVPEHAAAGIGQLITIQGFHLLVPGATTVTLTPVFSGSPTTCVSVLPPAPSGPNELYVRLGVFQSPNPAGCSNSIPSMIGPGLYRVTVTTPGGTSNAVPLAVFKPPATPIPRRLLKCSTSPCSPSTTFMPGDLLGKSIGRDEIGRAFRGSSALHAVGDSYLLLARPSANLAAVELRFQFRYAAPLAPRLLELEPHSLWFSAAGAAPSGTRPRRKVEPEDVTQALAGLGHQARHNQLRRELMELTDCSQRTAQLAIREACRQGGIVPDNGQYRLPL